MTVPSASISTAQSIGAPSTHPSNTIPSGTARLPGSTRVTSARTPAGSVVLTGSDTMRVAEQPAVLRVVETEVVARLLELVLDPRRLELLDASEPEA